jgi:hypothetical protein
MPDMHEVARARTPTKAFMPKRARKLWAECLAGTFGQIVKHNDARAWADPYFHPAVVLRSAYRGGGKRGKQKAKIETKERARAWLEGERGELWDSFEGPAPCKMQIPPRKQHDTFATARARAVELSREGLLSKACQALVSDPPVEIAEDVVQRLLQKHPKPREGEIDRVNTLRAVAAESVTKAIRFPKGSARGPSGLKSKCLEVSTTPGWSSEVGRQLAEVANLVAKGHMPHEARQPYNRPSTTRILRLKARSSRGNRAICG